MKNSGSYLVIAACAALASVAAAAQSPMQAKIDAEIAAVRAWASDPIVVGAVRARNAAAGAAADAMTQEAWTAAGPNDPLVRALMTNPLAAFLGAHRSAAMSEVFVNAADGRKVALLAKTTSWNHAGSAKHDRPMKGEVWQGQAEMDQSTGVESIQIAVPVLDGATPIGSIVVGLDVARLK